MDFHCFEESCRASCVTESEPKLSLSSRKNMRSVRGGCQMLGVEMPPPFLRLRPSRTSRPVSGLSMGVALSHSRH